MVASTCLGSHYLIFFNRRFYLGEYFPRHRSIPALAASSSGSRNTFLHSLRHTEVRPRHGIFHPEPASFERVSSREPQIWISSGVRGNPHGGCVCSAR